MANLAIAHKPVCRRPGTMNKSPCTSFGMKINPQAQIIGTGIDAPFLNQFFMCGKK